ncbi:MAG: glycosyltransferase [Alphaproteobacteria bacterium]
MKVEETGAAPLAETRLAVVCPMANERDTAVRFVSEVLAVTSATFGTVAFFAVLDRASRDGTLALLQEFARGEPRLQVVWAPENTCVVDAYLRGYREAIDSSADWILEIDAGFSHRPDDFPQFVQAMSQGYEVVFGSRFCPGGRMEDAPISRRILSRGGTWLVNLLLGTQLHDMTSGYELFQRHALAEILARGIQSRGHFFQTEIKVHARNMRITEVPIRYRSPSASVSRGVVADALSRLGTLFRQRLAGTL